MSSNLQVSSQGPHQLIFQIESRIDTRVFPIDMTIIMPVSPVFGESSGDPSIIPSDNPTKDPSPLPITKPSSGPSETSSKDPYAVQTN